MCKVHLVPRLCRQATIQDWQQCQMHKSSFCVLGESFRGGVGGTQNFRTDFENSVSRPVFHRIKKFNIFFILLRFGFEPNIESDQNTGFVCVLSVLPIVNRNDIVSSIHRYCRHSIVSN